MENFSRSFHSPLIRELSNGKDNNGYGASPELPTPTLDCNHTLYFDYEATTPSSRSSDDVQLLRVANKNGNSNQPGHQSTSNTPSGLVFASPHVKRQRGASQKLSNTYIDCAGRRRQYIGEKCFALLIVILVSGVLFTSFGSTCLIPVAEKDKFVVCDKVGGIPTALVTVCGGTALILLGVVACILIHECSDKELHGGRCHINCHIFDDLVI